MDYEEMKTILLNWLNPEQEEVVSVVEEIEEPAIIDTKPAQTTYSTPSPKKKQSSFDEDEFDALFTESTPKSPFKDEDDDLPWEK